MRMITELTVSINKRSFPSFIDELYKRNCEIHKLQSIEEKEDEDLCKIEVSYNSKKRFEEFITIISNAGEKYNVIEIKHTLEEKIEGGLLNITGKMPFDNISDYQKGLLGATDLISEKINEGNAYKYSGISRNVGLVSGIMVNEESEMGPLLKYYVESEKDSVILNRFSGLNGIPLILKLDHPEDIVKILQRLEQNFSVIRLREIENANMVIYDQLYSEISVPIISRERDEIPIYLLSLIIKILLKHRLKPDETTIGFIGIDLSAIMLTRLLGKIGCYRMLGFDYDENYMLSLENEGGLATTAENIFSNSDITILLKSNFESGEFGNIRPGQFIVSLLKTEELEMDVVSSKGIREFIKGDKSSLSVLFPGILNGIVDSGIRLTENVKMIEFTKKLVNFLSDDYKFPGIFSDIHEKVFKLVKLLSD